MTNTLFDYDKEFCMFVKNLNYKFILWQGTLTERLSTVDLLIRLACFDIK